MATFSSVTSQWDAVDRGFYLKHVLTQFPWTYSETETAYLLEGEVVVTPTGKVWPQIHLHSAQLGAHPAS
jgi:uncharacterized cupin superfamily protein